MMTKEERLELLKQRAQVVKDPLHEPNSTDETRKRKRRMWMKQRLINRVAKGIPRHPWRD